MSERTNEEITANILAMIRAERAEKEAEKAKAREARAEQKRIESIKIKKSAEVWGLN